GRSSVQPPTRKAARLTRTSATDATSLVDGRLPRRGCPSIRRRLCQKVQLRCQPPSRVTDHGLVTLRRRRLVGGSPAGRSGCPPARFAIARPGRVEAVVPRAPLPWYVRRE